MKSVAVLLLLLASTSVVSADDSPVDYARDVKSIFRERCYACHGALKQEAGLRLDTGSLVKTGGDSGAAIVPGDVEHSPLIERISAIDESARMPPEGKPLTPEQISVLTRWVQSGAASPDNEQPEQDPGKHWAFQKPVRPEVPVDRDATGTESARVNPIDAFIGAQRRSNSIVAMPTSDKATLLRRVCLDLKGLPPTADELLAFLADESPTAYEQAVDRLLASPQHGERWARHWMDVWRYSDWYGRRSVPDVMNSYPMVWRWRDWIVKSLNEDKPYNQMVVEMLAADELLPADDQNVVATGFLVRSWFKWNYETWKKDLVEHTGKAFLGLTLNCCQCHDHKYDPFSQEEYFRFRAFFEPLELRHDRVPGEADPGPFVKYVYTISYGPIKSGMVRVFDEYLDAETFMFSKGDSRLRIEGKPPMTPAAPAVLGGDKLQIAQIGLPITAAYPGMKEFVRAEELSKPTAAIAAAETELATAKAAFSVEPAVLRDELLAAETALNVARAEAQRQLEADASGTARQALEGTQSLVLDAKAGRRALSHTVPELSSLADNATVSYLVQIVQDEHTNFQLALDIAQGATGGYVAFEKGSIKSYHPGGFNEFVAGNYDLAKGQNRFRVQMQLDLSLNQFFLTVTSLTDNMVLVNAVPAAANGWKPQLNGKRGLFVDCRPGTEAIYDALTFTQPDGAKVLAFDFEPPAFSEGQDVVDAAAADSAPWMVTGYCQAPATSKITSAVSLNPAVQTAVARLKAAQQALRLPVLTIAAAESRLAAAHQQLTSLQQRIETDTVRYSTGLLSEDRQAEPEVKALIHAACQSERAAAVATAQANLATADQAIASAEVKIAEVSKQADQAAIEAASKSLQTAQQQRVTATTALNAANATLATEPGEYTPLSPKYPQITSGRRAALANWIASRDNPLTARVAVNHIWLRHFGQALVETTHDLGRNGSRPTHPELLNWLACELMDSGWSMKHVHRLIVTSRTYRLASMLPQSTAAASEQFASASALDPDNKLYWRFPAARMQAEVVRDSLLAVAGQLDETIGGHEIDHKQGMTSHRRSMYFAHHGEEKMEFLELFDAANACDCYKRTSSVQPQQALALTNSELTKTLSRQLATKLWSQVTREADSPRLTRADGEADKSEVIRAAADNFVSRFVKLAFLQVLNREPRDQELSASLSFLQQQAGRLTPTDGSIAPFDPNGRSRENLVHALMNHNDFVTIR